MKRKEHNEKILFSQKMTIPLIAFLIKTLETSSCRNGNATFVRMHLFECICSNAFVRMILCSNDSLFNMHLFNMHLFNMHLFECFCSNAFVRMLLFECFCSNFFVPIFRSNDFVPKYFCCLNTSLFKCFCSTIAVYLFERKLFVLMSVISVKVNDFYLIGTFCSTFV
jgi:hypothetical protein